MTSVCAYAGDMNQSLSHCDSKHQSVFVPLVFFFRWDFAFFLHPPLDSDNIKLYASGRYCMLTYLYLIDRSHGRYYYRKNWKITWQRVFILLLYQRFKTECKKPSKCNAVRSTSSETEPGKSPKQQTIDC